MPTLLSQVPTFVSSSFVQRQRAVQKNRPMSEDLLWMDSKTPWIKMQSNADLFGDNPNKGIVEKYVLYSGWLNNKTNAPFKTMYTGPEYKPFPAITGIESSIKGHLGIMREVTVKFKVYTLSQLEVVQDLYMTPGIGVLVEWGWSLPTSNVNSFNLYSVKSDGDGENRWLRKTLQEQIEKGKGNYDALFGLVCNFDIQFVDDGTWDCSTTIVGPGAMTVDISLKSPGNALDKKLVKFLEDRINAEMTTDSGKEFARCGMFKEIKTDMVVVTSPSEQQQKDKETEQNSKDQRALISSTNLYVTWEFVEDMLNQFFLTANNSKNVNFAGKDYINSYTGGFIPCMNFGEDTNMWRSMSPTEVLIPFHPKDLKNDVVGTGKVKKNFRKFDKDKRYGDLASVWLNYNTVVKPAFDASETMQEAIRKILSKMNDAVGGIWDLELMFNNEDYSSYRIVDLKCTHGVPNDLKIFVLNLNQKDSIVRDANISMTIPNALKATVMIAANAPDDVNSSVAERDKVGIFRSLSRGVRDRFASARTFQQLAQPVPAHKSSVPTETEEKQNTHADLVATATAKKWYEEYTGDEKEAVITEVFAILETGQDSGVISALIPLELTVTLDGIAGFTWGNAFNVTYLPKKYRDNALFQIKDISHSVSQDGWITTIVGLMRPKYAAKAVATPVYQAESAGTTLTSAQAGVEESDITKSVVTNLNDAALSAQTNMNPAGPGP
jgi:hypothetical protein